MPKTNITKEQCEVFAALTSGKHCNFALFSCFANGKPVTAIVAVNEDGEDVLIRPLFISIPDNVTLSDHDGNTC